MEKLKYVLEKLESVGKELDREMMNETSINNFLDRISNKKPKVRKSTNAKQIAREQFLAKIKGRK